MFVFRRFLNIAENTKGAVAVHCKGEFSCFIQSAGILGIGLFKKSLNSTLHNVIITLHSNILFPLFGPHVEDTCIFAY